ncbi:MAG: hypothetical protein KKG92_09485, partial [Gammaproteobacteria bacterium]|nr:hypothetical protein [Gammaproteobacteria bacterium]
MGHLNHPAPQQKHHQNQSDRKLDSHIGNSYRVHCAALSGTFGLARTKVIARTNGVIYPMRWLFPNGISLRQGVTFSFGTLM